MKRTTFLAKPWFAGLTLIGLLLSGNVFAQQQNLKEPVYRITKANADNQPVANAHPLDPALKMAREGLVSIRQNIQDYTCVLVKQERIKGELMEAEYIYTKVRNEKRDAQGRITVPLSVYMFFLKPSHTNGREVLFVKGHNNNKLLAHESPNKLTSKFGSIWLAPDSMMAMKGNLYPITDVGIENLIVKLIEKGERDRQRGEVEVTFREGVMIGDKKNKRRTTMLQVVHPNPRPYFDFHIARVFIDDELNVPIRYAAYDWPKSPGEKPELLETYTYLQLKVNQGLTDRDFDKDNPDYRF